MQRQIRRPWGIAILLQVVMGLAFLASVQNFLKDNGVTDLWPGSWLWNLKVMNTHDALAAFLGFLGLEVMRRQLGLTYRPYLNYSGGLTQQSGMELPLTAGERIWKTSLRNAGGSIAIVKTVRYRISSDAIPADYALDYARAVQELAQLGFKRAEDYALRHISAGASLGKDQDIPLFEQRETVYSRLRCLDIAIEFEGVLGDRFVKEVYCIPRIGIRKPTA